MSFEFPIDAADLAEALRAAEPQAPKVIKPLLIQAALKIDGYRRTLQDCATQIEEAAELRVGMMDSQSRADEVARQVRNTLQQVAMQLREQLK